MNAKTSFAAFALTLLVSAYAGAAPDAKFHPGAMCQTSNKDQVIFRNEQGRMYNSTAATQQTWICPVVRDVANATGIASATVVVEDRNPGVGSTFDVRCTLNSRTADGVLIASQLRISANVTDHFRNNVTGADGTAKADKSYTNRSRTGARSALLPFPESCGFLLSKRLAFEFQFMTLMHDPIQDSVGQRRIGQILMPMLDRELTGDDR